MSKYDDVKAKFIEFWEKLSSSEKQKLSEKLKNKFAKIWGKLKPSERKKISERCKDYFADIKDDLLSDKRRLVAMMLSFICLSLSVGAGVNSFTMMLNDEQSYELLEEVGGSEDYRDYESKIIVPYREAYNNGDITYEEFNNVIDSLNDRETILTFINNSDNEDWKERSKKVLTEEELARRCHNNHVVAVAGVGTAFSTALVWRAVDEVDRYVKTKKNNEEDYSLGE